MFKKAYETFIGDHRKKRTNERLRRLVQGHGHAERLFLEKVWWPAFGSFDHLHPEYEVNDFRDGRRFLDFAYLRTAFRFAIEIDGYGPHLRDVSRDAFSDERDRHTDLVIDGWKVVRFSFDRVNDQSRVCQRRLQNLMGKCLGEWDRIKDLSLEQREIVRLAVRLDRPITPKDIQEWLKVCNDYARKLLRSLILRKVLMPSSGGTRRIRSYRLASDGYRFLLD